MTHTPKEMFEVNHTCQTNGRVVVVSNNHAQINVLLAVDLPIVICWNFLSVEVDCACEIIFRLGNVTLVDLVVQVPFSSVLGFSNCDSSFTVPFEFSATWALASPTEL